ncbi:tetratricopeptide repeat protein [Luteimonas sp. MC1782]|nr:tetratricopeptide repeat protein [Luteimonas sp. MC1782]MBB1473918.1 tetratricopeptide repeat protein [Luteimonas sp. MC1782]
MTGRYFTSPAASASDNGVRHLARGRPRRSGTLLAAVLLLAGAMAAQARDTTARDPLEAVLAAEFAVSAGRLDEGTAWYLEAARALPDDAELAARATRYALMGRDNAALADALGLWRQRAPESAGMKGAAATLALRTGKSRAARRELESLLREDGREGLLTAMSVLGTGSSDQALSAEVLGELFDRGAIPRESLALAGAGELALGLGDQALFERIDGVARVAFPDDPLTALVRSRHLHQTGRSVEAKAVLDEIAAQPGVTAHPRMRENIALAYAEVGAPADGARLLESGPPELRWLALRASLLAQAEDKDGLGRLYDVLKADAEAPNPPRRLLLGQLAEYLELPAEALDWYRSVPGGEQRWLAQLRIPKVLHDLGKADEAYAELSRLQQDGVADADYRRDAYVMEAELRREDGGGDAELDAYARGLAAFVDDAALLYARALMWERRDDIARAEADLRRILLADPDSTAALNALGYTLADRTTRYDEALELIERARVAEPGNAAIIDSYGWVLYRLGRNEEAVVELRRAYVLEKDAEIAAHLGEVLWVLGRHDEARRYLEEARAIDPDNRALKRALEKTAS